VGNMLWLDHASVGIVSSKSDSVPIDAISLNICKAMIPLRISFIRMKLKKWGERSTKEALKPDKDKSCKD